MNWRKTQCCGTCVHWDIDSARNKIEAVCSDKAIRCFAVALYPDSVPEYARRIDLPHSRTFRDLGTQCPTWKASKEYQL